MRNMTKVERKLSIESLAPVGRPTGGAGLAAYDRTSVFTTNSFEPDGGLGFDLHELWRILNKWKWLVAGIAAAFMIAGLLWTLMVTPLYTSTVRLQIDRNAATIVEGGNVMPVEPPFDFEFLKTQYEILQSRNIAERVAAITHLASDPDFNKQAGFSLLALIGGSEKSARRNGQSSQESAAVQAILGNRVVRPLAGSKLVDVSYYDLSPERAQKIAAAYGEAFIAFNLDRRFQANSYARLFLEDQIKQLKLRLEESENALLAFAEKEKIVSTTDKTSIAENNLASANAALGNIVSERIKNEQQWRQVESSTAINLPQFLTNKVINDLRDRRNQLATDYQEKSETFQPSYPAMIQINNKIKEIDRQLAAEVKTIKSSLKAAYESSLSQENEMKKWIEVLRAEVLDFQKRSVQYDILKREADTTRSLYEALLQRFKVVDVAGGAGANNVFVVDAAELPRSASSPVASRNLALALALGLAAGLAVAYILERFDDVIQSPEEVERVSGLPTFGIIPKVEPRSAEAELANPHSALAEAYRTLSTTLQLSTEAGLPRSLLITSAVASEGKSITSLAIGCHFARMGLKVLLVDADLRDGSLHEMLGLKNNVGLSNYLTGGCSLGEAVQRTSLGDLSFLCCGPLPPNAAELLASKRLPSLLSAELEAFDLIIVDSAPIMGLADAPLLSHATAATLFVVAAGQSRRNSVRNGLARLRMTRAPVLGTIVTKLEVRTSDYGYGYGYGFGYGRTGGRDIDANSESASRNASPALKDIEKSVVNASSRPAIKDLV
jgi:succinoglycan biosynthesis transport protein ExoP